MANKTKKRTHRQSKYFTLMLVPFSSGKTYSVKIPMEAIYASVLAIVLIVVSVFVFLQTTQHFKAKAEAARYNLEKSAELNSTLELQKEELSSKLVTEKINAEETSKKQLEEYDEKIKYYEDRAAELEQKLDDLNKAKEEIYNQLSSKAYLPDIDTVAFSGESGQVVLTGMFGDENENSYNFVDLDSRFEKLSKDVNNELVSYDHLMGEIKKIKPYLDNYPTIWPCNGPVTSEHAYRGNPFSGRGSEFHAGIDIGVDIGTSIHATGGGTVIRSGYENGFGYLVAIDHGHGIVTYYGHNSKLLVNAGDEVKRGDIIAKSGNSGRSTGPHCHYEVKVNGVTKNPRGYLGS